MLCLLPHQRYTENSLGERMYDRHFLDLSEEDIMSRLSPRLGLTIRESGPRTPKLAVSITNTRTMRHYEWAENQSFGPTSSQVPRVVRLLWTR